MSRKKEDLFKSTGKNNERLDHSPKQQFQISDDAELDLMSDILKDMKTVGLGIGEQLKRQEAEKEQKQNENQEKKKEAELKDKQEAEAKKKQEEAEKEK